MLRKVVPQVFVAVILALGGLTLSYPALACGRDTVDFEPPPRRPIQLTAGEQAAQLRAQADSLDARAAIDDRNATILSQEGEGLLARARALRIQALSAPSEIERSSLLARAGALASQGSADISEASQLRSESMQ